MGSPPKRRPIDRLGPAAVAVLVAAAAVVTLASPPASAEASRAVICATPAFEVALPAGCGPSNTPPTAVADSYSTSEDTALSVGAGTGVLANDTDGDGDTLHATLAGLPTHGQVQLADDGSFTYAPATNFTGVDHFTYTASDGSTSTTETSVAVRSGTVTRYRFPTVRDRRLPSRAASHARRRWAGLLDGATGWRPQPRRRRAHARPLA